ncbi:LOW QUALITY PROTEIN: uncharacterized protein LOC108115598 [Drosophila eugracilis]|uniref:LOW QUALITY PROTEIN: uncharacterized protein LOC108115598 n=1 Tax=Drosophila eugracilis TaxID=29029 RepID=UPI001BD9E6DD|nr:LOW QUALITY PROTEIN: uncharacterized protein LOC108115598 [Drosophila eugracilis]
MKTTLLLTFVMMTLGVTLSLVLAGADDDGYLYGQPSGEQLQEIQAVSLPRKQRLKPRVYPQHPSQGCGNVDEADHVAALTTYQANRPQPRRIYKHQEIEVESSFFEPSQERIEELKRILLDQE